MAAVCDPLTERVLFDIFCN